MFSVNIIIIVTISDEAIFTFQYVQHEENHSATGGWRRRIDGEDLVVNLQCNVQRSLNLCSVIFQIL